MEWLRLYSEILNDSKIMLLPEAYRWRYIALLCIASESKERGTIPSDEEVLFKLRISEDEWGATLQVFTQHGLVEKIDGICRVHGFKESQGVLNNLRPNANEWQSLRAIVFERDNFTCQYCGKHGVRLECDHIIPISRGGSNELDNLQTACFNCNRSKRNKLVEEWRAK